MNYGKTNTLLFVFTRRFCAWRDLYAHKQKRCFFVPFFRFLDCARAPGCNNHPGTSQSNWVIASPNLQAYGRKNAASYKDSKKKFEEQLKEKVPNLKKAHFIYGGRAGSINLLMENLLEMSGGLHCLTCEEPNFEIWG